jgi:hypothetical protein
MSSRNAAPTDFKDPEITQQNLPKGETWYENECAPLSFLPKPAPLPLLGLSMIDRRLTIIGQSERKGKDQIRSSAWEGRM